MPMVFLDNICVTLTEKITSSSPVLSFSGTDTAKLCAALGANFSYLTLNTPLGSEIIRVACSGGVVTVTRGQGGTNPLAAAKGTCLCFKVNKLVLDNYLPQGYCEPSIVTTTPDFIEIIPPVDPSCQWTVNIKQSFIDRFEECCPEDDCTNCTVADGVYENAKVTVINGKVCAISNGTNIVYTGGGCCGCAT
jgi:hypothetical protein